MFGIENLFGFIIASTLVIFAPGPATFFVMSKARQTPISASYAALGIMSGDILLITLAGMGFASLVARWPMVLLLIKIFGALYLGYLGFQLIVFNKQTRTINVSVDSETKRKNYIKGLLITLTNPKPILFFVAFFPLFISTNSGDSISDFYFLGFIFQLINLIYFSLIVLVTLKFSRLAIFGKFSGGGFNLFTGFALIACALTVLLSIFI